jgi:hypothetical protein
MFKKRLEARLDSIYRHYKNAIRIALALLETEL